MILWTIYKISWILVCRSHFTLYISDILVQFERFLQTPTCYTISDLHRSWGLYSTINFFLWYINIHWNFFAIKLKILILSKNNSDVIFIQKEIIPSFNITDRNRSVFDITFHRSFLWEFDKNRWIWMQVSASLIFDVY